MYTSPMGFESAKSFYPREPARNMKLAGRRWFSIKRHPQAMFRTCARENCGGRLWISHWSSSICFQNQWYCCAACLEHQLRVVLKTSAPASSNIRPAHRIPLGLLMLSKGLLSTDQLTASLQRQQDAGHGRIGEWMRGLGYASERDITAALAMQWSCPRLALDTQPDAKFAGLLPASLLERFGMAPVHFSPSRHVLFIGFEERVDYSLLYAISQILNCQTEPCILSHSAWVRAQNGQRRLAEVAFENRCEPDEKARIVRSYMTRYGAKELRMVSLKGCFWFRLISRAAVADVLFHDARVRLHT